MLLQNNIYQNKKLLSHDWSDDRTKFVNILEKY